MTTIAQILVAAGKGARFLGDKPKQYTDIEGRPLLRHTLEACYRACPATTQFVIVVADNDPYIKNALQGFKAPVKIVTGGATRTQSVRAGMQALAQDPPDIVLIHDAARPFVRQTLYNAVLDGLKTHAAAAPVLPIADAIKQFNAETIGGDVNRHNLRRIQTPQGFRFQAVWPLYAALDDKADFSDDIAIAYAAKLNIAAVKGDPDNIKITYPDDKRAFKTMSTCLSLTDQPTQYYSATGSGYDVHRIEPGDHLWLCGVKIEAGFGLKGHSDADVGLHALTDAILGALCSGDIGEHFPPSDPQWAGAASDQFLQHARNLTLERGGRIQHVDITLICERPKIGPHKMAMRQTIAKTLSLPINRISVKATTTEKLGFTGRGEGIAAQAIATLRLPEAAS